MIGDWSHHSKYTHYKAKLEQLQSNNQDIDNDLVSTSAGLFIDNTSLLPKYNITAHD